MPNTAFTSALLKECKLKLRRELTSEDILTIQSMLQSIEWKNLATFRMIDIIAAISNQVVARLKQKFAAGSLDIKEYFNNSIGKRSEDDIVNENKQFIGVNAKAVNPIDINIQLLLAVQNKKDLRNVFNPSSRLLRYKFMLDTANQDPDQSNAYVAVWNLIHGMESIPLGAVGTKKKITNIHSMHLQIARMPYIMVPPGVNSPFIPPILIDIVEFNSQSYLDLANKDGTATDPQLTRYHFGASHIDNYVDPFAGQGTEWRTDIFNNGYFRFRIPIKYVDKFSIRLYDYYRLNPFAIPGATLPATFAPNTVTLTTLPLTSGGAGYTNPATIYMPVINSLVTTPTVGSRLILFDFTTNNPGGDAVLIAATNSPVGYVVQSINTGINNQGVLIGSAYYYIIELTGLDMTTIIDPSQTIQFRVADAGLLCLPAALGGAGYTNPATIYIPDSAPVTAPIVGQQLYFTGFTTIDPIADAALITAVNSVSGYTVASVSTVIINTASFYIITLTGLDMTSITSPSQSINFQLNNLPGSTNVTLPQYFLMDYNLFNTAWYTTLTISNFTTGDPVKDLQLITQMNQGYSFTTVNTNIFTIPVNLTTATPLSNNVSFIGSGTPSGKMTLVLELCYEDPDQ